MIVGFLIISSLNTIKVEVDLLFVTLQEDLGKVILISFLTGILVALVSEVLYFLNKRSNKELSE